ncbi:MAG: redoxin domain-containing protein [Acidobacteria bacterium]|nr:MAG: redoxin domain-containing protein [Acidobacteriota bacterium]
MDRFRELGVALWVISPDKAEDLEKMRASMGLEFPLLRDPDLSTIRSYGILNQESGKIPHPTTVVVDVDGVARYVRVDRDYKRRPALEEVFAAIGNLARAGAPGTLIVLNKAEGTASLIDLTSGEVVATLPTGVGPHEVAASPDGRLAVVTNYGDREQAGSSLTVLDIPAARVLRTIDLGDDHKPHGIQFLGGSTRVAVTVEDSKAVLIVDIETGRVLSRLETAQEISHMLAVTPDGRRAFVANIGSGSVTVLDLDAGKLLANIPTGEGAEGIDITPDGRQVWITNRAADTITVLDAASLAILETIPSSSFPIRARVTPDGRSVLVSHARSGDVAVFDAATRKEVRRIPMNLTAEVTEGRLFGGRFGESSVPIGILIHPNGRQAYVANANADIISIVNLDTWVTDGFLTAGKEPDGLAYSALNVKPGDGGHAR